jgi:peptidyl-prolyl cis-trans isomerase C
MRISPRSFGFRRALLAVALAAACRKPKDPASEIVADFRGGAVTRAEVEREGAKLPPRLRSQFESPAGRRELAESMVDKRLLVAEALRRGYDQDPEVRRQVDELRDRLVVQALLAEEEKKLPPPTEAEERAWFDAHRADLSEPERVHLARILFKVSPRAPAQEQAKARAKAEAVVKKLRGGAKVEAVAAQGEGPERSHGGDLGLIARGDLHDRKAEDAAFALAKAGDATAPVQTADGFAVLVLLERKPARAAVFEEMRPQIRARLDPGRKRKAFDDLRLALRKQNDVRIHSEAAR